MAIDRCFYCIAEGKPAEGYTPEEDKAKPMAHQRWIEAANEAVTMYVGTLVCEEHARKSLVTTENMHLHVEDKVEK